MKDNLQLSKKKPYSEIEEEKMIIFIMTNDQVKDNILNYKNLLF